MERVDLQMHSLLTIFAGHEKARDRFSRQERVHLGHRSVRSLLAGMLARLTLHLNVHRVDDLKEHLDHRDLLVDERVALESRVLIGCAISLVWKEKEEVSRLIAWCFSGGF